MSSGFMLGNRTTQWRSKDVTISSKTETCTIKVRGLSDNESNAADLAFQRPEPPKVPDPQKGSLAPPVPDFDDPGYAAALQVYYANASAAIVAIAIDAIVPELGSFPAATADQTAWLQKATAMIRAEFSHYDIETLLLASKSLAGFETIKAMAHHLIVEVKPGSELAGNKQTLELPKNWLRSEAGLLVRAAARFGQDPATWPKTLSAVDRAMVIADQLLLYHEEEMKSSIVRGV